jgi:ornithine cyclodeaminase/alanine dehydrogenase-like protein (mu-crystallin family)
MVMYLSEPEVAKVLTYEQLIPCMEMALAELSNGNVTMPVRNMITVEENLRFMAVMPAVMANGMGAKLVCFYPKNAGTSHHTHTASIALFDPETGEPLAFMDGRLITEMRTAAVSAAVTKQAANLGSGVLALLGSGTQAHAHVDAMRHVMDVREIRVWSRNAEHARTFAAKYGAKAMSAEDAVKGADVIVVATSSHDAVLKGAWLKPGAHVNTVGSVHPKWRELDDDAMHNILIADSREAVCKESGDVILSKAPIFAEAGEIFSGKKTVDRAKTTIFKSVGLAVEDIATARLVYDLIRQNGSV